MIQRRGRTTVYGPDKIVQKLVKRGIVGLVTFLMETCRKVLNLRESGECDDLIARKIYKCGKGAEAEYYG